MSAGPGPRPRALLVVNGTPWTAGILTGRLPAHGVDVDLATPANLPRHLERRAYSGLVVLAGSVSVHDHRRAFWYPAVIDALRDAVARRLPTLGICLGAQLLAVACGGEVATTPSATEKGFVTVQTLPEGAATDPLFGALPSPTRTVMWHKDNVVTLPPGATALAATPVCPYAAYRVGGAAWGVQFHPEADASALARWRRHDAGPLRALVQTRRLRAARAADRRDAPPLRAVWGPFVERWARLVVDAQGVHTALKTQPDCGSEDKCSSGRAS